MRGAIIRPGHAIGDAIFVTALPRILKEEQGYSQIDVFCQEHNFDVFKHNPFIDDFMTIPTSNLMDKDEFDEKTAKYDKLFKVFGHLEVGLLHRTDADWGSIPSGEKRRELAKDLSYQDFIFKQVGVEKTGILPEFYFTDEEKGQMAQVRADLDEQKQKLVLWNWEGSSNSKKLVFAPRYLEEVLKKHQHSIHYVFANDPNFRNQIPKHPRVHDAMGISSIRNTIMLCSLADLVIGPESFLVNAAGAFDTLKMIFFSHSAPENLAMYYKNCHAVVPLKDLECHPCYMIHVNFREIWHPEKRAIARLYERNCQTWDDTFPYRMNGYKCCFYLPHPEIVETIIKILKQKRR